MADNTRLNAGAGGDLLATDDDGTAKHQYVKLEYGADNTYTPVTKSEPVPVGGNIVADGSGTLVPLLVDVGGHLQIDVVSIIPATGATNLGKAEDAAHTTGDVGVMLLGVRQDDASTLVDTDGDYSPVTLSDHGCLNVDPQHYYELDTCDATTGWSVLNDDAGNITTDLNHVKGTASLEFDKLNGASNTTLAVVQKTITSVDVNKFMDEGGGFLLWSMYLSSLANVDYVLIRLGTDSTNYNEWRVQDDDLTAGTWNNLRAPMTAPNGTAGNGWNSAAVTYLAIGVAFDNQVNELADILVDAISLNSGLQTSSDITAQVSTSIGNPNVNVKKWGATNVTTNEGAFDAGTLRITQATDDDGVAHLATIAGDTTSMDGNITACNTGAVVIASGTVDTVTAVTTVTTVTTVGAVTGITNALPAGNNNIGNVDIVTVPAPLNVVGGGTEAAALRVTIANDSTGVVSVDDGGGTLTVDSGAAFTIQEDGAALTALQLIDDVVVVLGTATYTETTTKGNVVGAVRNDDLATLAGTDNEIAPLQVNAAGALYTTDAPATVLRFNVVAAAGDVTLIAADASFKFRVLSLALFATSGTVTNVYIHNDDNDLLGNTGNRISLDKDGGDGAAGLVLPHNPNGWFETDTVNQALEIDLSVAQDVIAIGTYIKVA